MEPNSSGIRKVPLISRNVQLTSECFFLLLLGLIWSQSVLVAYFKAILMRLPYITHAREYIIAFIFLMALILALPYMAKRVSPWLILTYIAVVVVYLLNFFFYPNNRTALEANMVPFLCRSLPLVFIGVSIDLQKHYKFLYYVSLVSAVCAIVRTLINPVNMEEGDMYSAYVLLPHVCMVMVAALERKKSWDIIVSLVGAFTIMAFGTRGPILCMISLLVLYMLMYHKIYKHIWFTGAVVVFAVLVVFLYEETLLQIRWLVEQIGMSTRVVDLMLSGEFAESTGRNRIFALLFEAISQNPLGYGIAGDRLLAGSYSHNVLIELWVSFGVFTGTLVFVVPIICTVKLMIQRKSNRIMEDNFILVLIVSSYIKLFLSGTYLTESLLYLLIGILISAYVKDKRESNIM